jgi:hypothetical protein
MVSSVLDKNKIEQPAYLSYTVKATYTSIAEIHLMKFLHITSLFKSGA